MYETISREKIKPIQQLLSQYRAGGKLNVPQEDQAKFSELFRRQTKIHIDFSQKSPFSFLEILTAATWFLAEKYEFRADVLGLAVGTIKSHENRIKIKLGIARSAQAYCWFLSKKIISIDF